MNPKGLKLNTFVRLKPYGLTRGYYRTPKINEFNDMIEYLNKSKNISLPLTKIDNSDLDCNAWLSGFLETNGGFFIYPVLRQGSIRSFLEIGKHSYFTDYYVGFTLTHKKEYKDNYSYRPFLLWSSVELDKVPLRGTRICSFF